MQEDLVASTTDGGTTWSYQTSSGTNNFAEIACPSVNICYALGNYGVDVSSNGGTTWSNQTLPLGTTKLNGIACSSVSTCYAVGQGSGGLIISNS